MNATNENFTKYKNSREECALRNWKKKKKEKFRFMKPSYIYIYISVTKKTVPPYGNARWLEGLVGLRRGKTGRVKVRQRMFPRNYAKLHPPVAL